MSTSRTPIRRSLQIRGETLEKEAKSVRQISLALSTVRNLLRRVP
jgi:hypothetical protein